MGDKTPKLSPRSMSIWEDPNRPNLWRWSVHHGETVIERGTSVDYGLACRQAAFALGKVKSQTPKPERLGVQ
jgi:hypothetical protein